MKKLEDTTEHKRLVDSEERLADWKLWGPYLSDRAWGTVREDYSGSGEAWEFFPHDHARSRAYRWNEDGLLGISDRLQSLCLAVSLWNERDPILKERLFGLTGNEGNHGEDVKEYYFYLDSTPSHSYMKALYKYPQAAYPYGDLVEENRRRGRGEPEYELFDALRDTWLENRYFDVMVEYAKQDQDDILCRITAINRGPEAAPIHILPCVWYRNTWSWSTSRQPQQFTAVKSSKTVSRAHTEHRHLGNRWFAATAPGAKTAPHLLFTENNTNYERLFNQPNPEPYVKDGINDAVVHGKLDRVNPARAGSKVAAHFHHVVPPGGEFVVQVRFTPKDEKTPFAYFDETFAQRKQEADEYYSAIHPPDMKDDERRVQRQAFAGLMWSKQFYHLSVELWLNGDSAQPKPPESRLTGRNSDWSHLYNLDVISMPDKWEYPWYAAWDLAFHTLPISMIDPEWAKRQLILILREWYMHPNGQIPAYEWAFGDVNPPVHAWAAWRVYKMTRNQTGHADTAFLERVFHKLMLNFNWWVNRKDAEGRNVFQGGFLGLDNIGVFDRSARLPEGYRLDQADGTAWMAMYCLNMLAIAFELARTKPAYEDVATKFFEHFIYIANAIKSMDGRSGLWNQEDGFFYDMLHTREGEEIPLKIRSFVGLIPLFAVETLEPDLMEILPRFKRRMDWFIKYRPNLLDKLPLLTQPGVGGRRLLSLVSTEQLQRLLERMLDPQQFLSDYGLRSLSKEHGERPYVFQSGGQTNTVRYEPAESASGLFGGNSNWRGPIWFPINYLMIESLQKFHHYYGDALKVEMPRGSGEYMSLWQAAAEIGQRLGNLLVRDKSGRRAFYGPEDYFHKDPHWRDLVLFYEYFHGDTGAGVGASHQTGWTALVAKLLQSSRTTHNP